MRNKLGKIGLVALMSVVLFGCEKVDTQGGLTILAGSEIKNIEPLMTEASKKLGFPIKMEYTGTIEGVEAVKSGSQYSAAWFGNAKYFYDVPESAKRIKLSEKVMLSPVIVGVKETSLQKAKVDPNGIYTWKDISSWVKNQGMTYAMTDPSVSNTGYVALMGVVYATANKGENLKLEDVNQAVLKDFFKGQKVTAKSSNWIMSTFDSDPTIDFVVNYESSILSHTGQSKIVPIYPSEGIVTADYPIMLLDDKKTEQYKQLVAYLKGVEVQTQLVNTYKYHSVVPSVMLAQKVFDSSKLLVEMPFNPDSNLSDAILTAYYNDYKKPAKFAFVIDTSGSMSGNREMEMKDAVAQLVNGSLSKFATIRNRESVIVVPFSTQPYGVQSFDSSQKTEMNQYIQNLRMEGGTAMYDGVAQAINHLETEKAKHGDAYRYSVIVLTDGVSNEGADMVTFEKWYAAKKLPKGDMRVFAISFGTADMNQLTSLTSVTGGAVFDGKKSLGAAFREIRSSQ